MISFILPLCFYSSSTCSPFHDQTPLPPTPVYFIILLNMSSGMSLLLFLLHLFTLSLFLFLVLFLFYLEHFFHSSRNAWASEFSHLSLRQLPKNSWCFLELATVMRLVHMVRSETGPVATGKQSHRLKHTYQARPQWCHQSLFAGKNSFIYTHTY